MTLFLRTSPACGWKEWRTTKTRMTTSAKPLPKRAAGQRGWGGCAGVVNSQWANVVKWVWSLFLSDDNSSVPSYFLHMRSHCGFVSGLQPSYQCSCERNGVILGGVWPLLSTENIFSCGGWGGVICLRGNLFILVPLYIKWAIYLCNCISTM